MAVRPCHTVPLHQRTPPRLDLLDHAARALGRAERDEHLVQHDVVQDLVPVVAQAGGEAAGMRAGALEQIAQARPAQRQQRRPHLDAARAPRELGDVLVGLAEARPRQVGARSADAARRAASPRRDRRRGRCRRARSATCGRRWPRSRRPRVPRRASASAGAARAHSPKAPSTCTQAPGRARAVDDRARPGRRRRCSRCRPAGRRWCARRAAGSASARMRPWPSTGTRSTRSLPRPSERERLQHAHVHLVADDDAQRRRAEQAVRFDVPALRARAARGGRPPGRSGWRWWRR